MCVRIYYLERQESSIWKSSLIYKSQKGGGFGFGCLRIVEIILILT